jgi:hypothetical protein
VLQATGVRRKPAAELAPPARRQCAIMRGPQPKTNVIRLADDKGPATGMSLQASAAAGRSIAAESARSIPPVMKKTGRALGGAHARR